MARQHLQNGENMSFWKKCPLLAAVIVSGLVIEGAGVANGVKSGEIENPASWKQPALASVFIDLKQGVYPWSDRSVQTAAMDAADVQKDRITEETGGQANEGNGGEKAGQMANADRDADHKNGTGDENEAGVSGNAVPGKAAEETQEAEEEPLEFTHVDKEYFADAVFIGDSRTVGMYEYGGLEETSTFYASTGLTIYKMFDSKIVAVPGQKKKITVEEALSEKQFAKIYLMIGINEMGTGTVESFMKAYGEAVQHLQQLQPDAVIYLQAIMKVTTERSGQGDYITNEGIEARNEEIAKLADDEKIYYLDVNPLICDETGGMVASYTYDGVHLKARYIPIWLDFLKEHAVE